MLACSRPQPWPRRRAHESLPSTLLRALWFRLRFSRDQQLRYVGDEARVHEIAHQYFGKDPDALTDLEAAVVATLAYGPRHDRPRRLAKRVSHRLLNCR